MREGFEVVVEEAEGGGYEGDVQVVKGFVEGVAEGGGCCEED